MKAAADDRENRRPQAIGLCRVAPRLFLDDAFEQAGNEGHTARLDCLEVARSEQPRRTLVARVGNEFASRSSTEPTRDDPAAIRAMPRIGGVEELLTVGAADETSKTQPSLTATVDGPSLRQPGPSDQRRVVSIGRERLRAGQLRLHDPSAFRPASSTRRIASTSKTLPPHGPPLASWSAAHSRYRPAGQGGSQIRGLAVGENSSAGLGPDDNSTFSHEVDRAFQLAAIDDDLDEITVPELADGTARERFGEM